jgi:hypothetical protein
MDRLEVTLAALRAGLADAALSPVQAALLILDRELAGMTGWLAGQEDASQARHAVRRFGDLIRATPALRAYQADMLERSVAVATEVLAARGGTTPDDPEPQIARPGRCSGCGASRPTACASTSNKHPRRPASTNW